MTARDDKWHAEALYLAKQWKGRADDAGRLARAVLESTPSHEQQNAAPAGEIARKQDGVLAHRSTPPAGAAPSTTLRSRACPYCAHENSAIRETYFDQTCEGCVKRMGGEKAMRESVDEVLEIVGTYGPWGRDINEGLRYQIVLADEVKRLRSIPSAIRQTAQEDEAHFILNGYERKWRSYSHFNGSVVSYEDVVEWSGIDSDRERIRERVYTVTYAMPNGSGKRGGTLAAGESVPFESGMVFNVTRTTNA